MKYLYWKAKDKTYYVRDEKPHISEMGPEDNFVFMSKRPKKGQFWRDRDNDRVVYITSIYFVGPKYDKVGAPYRGVSTHYMAWNTRNLSGHEHSLYFFLQRYKPIDDHKEIMEHLRKLLGKCSNLKHARNILKSKELPITEEDRNLLLLSVWE